MKKFKVKDGVVFEGLQWTEQSSFEGVNKFCVNWLIKTAFGMLRINLGNYVFKGPGNFRMVLDPSTFSQIFEVVDGDK
jgi:hypothetical protein